MIYWLNKETMISKGNKANLGFFLVLAIVTVNVLTVRVSHQAGGSSNNAVVVAFE